MTVGIGVNVPLDPSDLDAAGLMQRLFGIPFERFATYTPVGPAEQIDKFFRPYVDAGVSTLNLTPCGPDRASEIDTIATARASLDS
ncbi:MAG: hypothetical protein AAGF73_04315 [Actinomycetota bacterium]